MSGDKKKAVNELKKGLEKFRSDALNKGWEQEEVDEKISEVFENFPWYKYNPPKKSWKTKVFHFLLFSLIAYLMYGAVMERNRRWKKRIDDYIFDSQISYHSHRLMRIITLPLFKIYDLSKFHDRECIINNPFKTEESVDCGYCQGIEKIASVSIESPDVSDMLTEEEPFVMSDVPNYHNVSITFNDLKEMFAKNPKELDEAVCNIEKNNEYQSVSEFFEKISTEELMNEKNISIEWSNCDTYGTRFYRRIFTRPLFIAKEAEINFEKRIFMLQKGENSTLKSSEGRNYYLYQVQGESIFEMKAQSQCHYNCTEKPITTTLRKGDIAVSPAAGWISSFETTGDGLNILFLSSFT